MWFWNFNKISRRGTVKNQMWFFRYGFGALLWGYSIGAGKDTRSGVCTVSNADPR